MSRCLKPEDTDAWVPGSLTDARACQAALQGCMSASKDPRYRAWFHGFAYGDANALTSSCPFSGSLGGGCGALVRPETAYYWTTQLKPLLKEQIRRMHAKEEALPIGNFNGNPAYAVCSIDSGRYTHCRAIHEPVCTTCKKGGPRITYPGDGVSVLAPQTNPECPPWTWGHTNMPTFS